MKNGFVYAAAAVLVSLSICMVSCRDDEEDRYSPPTKNTTSNTSNNNNNNNNSSSNTSTSNNTSTQTKTEEKKNTPLTGRALNGDVINMIDLGLPSGTKWADRNIGAELPANDGDKYAWGELYTKSEYSRETYEFYSYYGGYQNIGTSIAGTKYDVATFRWGEGYTIPTYTQINESHGRKYGYSLGLGASRWRMGNGGSG